MNLANKLNQIEQEEKKETFMVRMGDELLPIEDYMIRDYSNCKKMYLPNGSGAHYTHDLKSDPNFDFIF
tara:strand:- start:70 stop:276 length:207 start_codon:yes stop_codon:yes gene_type:complete